MILQENTVSGSVSLRAASCVSLLSGSVLCDEHQVVATMRNTFSGSCEC